MTDTVELGLVLVRVQDLVEIGYEHGSTTAVHTENNIADLLRHELRPVDRAARLSRTEFLLVLPAVPAPHVRSNADHMREAFARLHETYPHVALRNEWESVLETR